MWKIGALCLVGFVGAWLLLWDFINWLTNGLNNGIWDNTILINGIPSMSAGVVIILIVGVLGFKVLK